MTRPDRSKQSDRRQTIKPFNSNNKFSGATPFLGVRMVFACAFDMMWNVGFGRLWVVSRVGQQSGPVNQKYYTFTATLNPAR